jgi:site-specific recombinase XerC
MRLLSVLNRYLVQLQADGRSPFWRDQIARHVRFLDRWLGEHRLPRDARRVTHEHLARFLASPEANSRLDGRPKKATSTNALRSSVRVFFEYTHAAGHAPRNAAALVRRAKCAPPPPRAIPPDDLKRLLAAIDAGEGDAAARDSALFHLLAETGIRIGSALAARIEDLDLRHRELSLTTTKGNRPTVIRLPAGLCRQLQHLLDGRAAGPLFATAGGQPLGGRQARRRFTEWLRRAGVRRHASPHALRHAFARAAYRRTGDLLAVKEALHHRSVASSQVYARADE